MLIFGLLNQELCMLLLGEQADRGSVFSCLLLRTDLISKQGLYREFGPKLHQARFRISELEKASLKTPNKAALNRNADKKLIVNDMKE